MAKSIRKKAKILPKKGLYFEFCPNAKDKIQCLKSIWQELRTVTASPSMDEAGHRLVNEVALERIPALDLSAPTLDFQMHKGAQGAEEVGADVCFPAHEEAFGTAELFDGAMITLNAPMLPMHMAERADGDFHALFFRGSWAA
jgi:hypothetical protein